MLGETGRLGDVIALKITIVLGPFQALPPDGYGAVEKVWYEFAQVFARLGHKVVLVGKSVPSNDSPRNTHGLQILRLRGFRATERLWKNLLKDFLYALEVRRRIELSEIIVTNSFWTPVVLGFFGSRFGKIIVHVARFPKGQMRLYRGADALQAISTAVAQEIVRQCPSMLKKVHVLAYPIQLRTYRPPALDRQYGEDRIVLYVGRVHPEKGLDLLIAAFRHIMIAVPRARLRIVGPVAIEQGGGGKSYLEILMSAAAGLPVDFVGPIREPAALALEYQRAYCFCYPSLAERGEALGLAVLEAMATALPVVVSDLPCFRDFIEPGKNGLAFERRAQAPALALSELLRRILTDSQFSLQLGRNAANRAQDFDLEKVARQYLAFFEEVSKG